MKAMLFITTDISPFKSSFEDVAHIPHELVQRFLGGLDSLSQLIRVDTDSFPATGAREIKVILYPSDLLVEFLAAHRAS